MGEGLISGSYSHFMEKKSHPTAVEYSLRLKSLKKLLGMNPWGKGRAEPWAPPGNSELAFLGKLNHIRTLPSPFKDHPGVPPFVAIKFQRGHTFLTPFIPADSAVGIPRAPGAGTVLISSTFVTSHNCSDLCCDDTIAQIYAVMTQLFRFMLCLQPSIVHQAQLTAICYCRRLSFYRVVFFMSETVQNFCLQSKQSLFWTCFVLRDCISTACLKLKPKGGIIRCLIYY